MIKKSVNVFVSSLLQKLRRQILTFSVNKFFYQINFIFMIFRKEPGS